MNSTNDPRRRASDTLTVKQLHARCFPILRTPFLRPRAVALAADERDYRIMLALFLRLAPNSSNSPNRPNRRIA